MHAPIDSMHAFTVIIDPIDMQFHPLVVACHSQENER